MNTGAVSFTGGSADQRTAVLQFLEDGFYHGYAYQNVGAHRTFLMSDPIGYTSPMHAHVTFRDVSAFDANAFAWHRYGSITTDVHGSSASFTMELADTLEVPAIYDVIAHMLGHWIIDIISQFDGPVGELTAAMGGGPWGGGGDNALEGACEAFRELTLMGVSSTRSLSQWKASRATIVQVAVTMQSNWGWSFPTQGERSPQSSYGGDWYELIPHREVRDLTIGSLIQTGGLFPQTDVDTTTVRPEWVPHLSDSVGWVIYKGYLYERNQIDPEDNPPSATVTDQFRNPYWIPRGPAKPILTYPWATTVQTAYVIRREMTPKRFGQFASLVDLHGAGGGPGGGQGPGDLRVNWMASSPFRWPKGPVIVPGYYFSGEFAYPVGAYYATTAFYHGPDPYPAYQYWNLPKGVINIEQWSTAFMDWQVICEASVNPFDVAGTSFVSFDDQDLDGFYVPHGGATWSMSHGMVPRVPFWSEVNIGRVTSGAVRH